MQNKFKIIRKKCSSCLETKICLQLYSHRFLVLKKLFQSSLCLVSTCNNQLSYKRRIFKVMQSSCSRTRSLWDVLHVFVVTLDSLLRKLHLLSVVISKKWWNRTPLGWALNPFTTSFGWDCRPKPERNQCQASQGLSETFTVYVALHYS